MSVLELAEGVTVVREGAPRQSWSHDRGSSRWFLQSIWPSARERHDLNRRLRSGSPLLVIQNSMGDHVDVLDEELAMSRDHSAYVRECESGITTLFIPSLDWLPPRLARSADAHIREHLAIQRIAGTTGAILTPPLGPRRNLRVLHLDSPRVAELSADCVASFAQLAFPRTHPSQGAA